MNPPQTLPPYAHLLGCTIERTPDGAPELVLPFADDVIGRPGFLHGGAIAGLLEVAAIAMLAHGLEEEGGGRIKPVTVTVDFMRGGRDHTTRAAARIVRLGRRIANVEAIAWQDDRDRPIATARMTYRISRPEPVLSE